MTFVKEKLSELQTTMFGRKGKVKDMDQCIVELKAKGEDKELRAEMWGALNIVIEDFSK